MLVAKGGAILLASVSWKSSITSRWRGDASGVRQDGFSHEDALPNRALQTAAGAGGRGCNVDGLAGVRHPAIIYRLVEAPSARKTPGVDVDSGGLLAWEAARWGPILAEPAWPRASWPG